MPPRPVIAVFGSSTVQPGDAVYDLALRLGKEVAGAGADLMTGGYGGTMEACSRGAHELGGHVVGVTVELFEARGPVNRWVRQREHTPDLYERLRHLVERADGFIVLPGSIGTLTELFLTWTLLSVGARPRAALVLLGEAWQPVLDAHARAGFISPDLFRHIQVTRDPAAAARLALAGTATAMRAGA